MLLLTLDDQLYDEELNSTSLLLQAIDRGLGPLHEAAKTNEGARDAAEHLVGFGFVACQRYINSAIAHFPMKPRAALGKGPMATDAFTVVEVVNAAANLWKHHGEYEDAVELRDRQERTLDKLEAVLGPDEWEFKFVNTLHALTDEVRLSGLVEVLTEWRDTLGDPFGGDGKDDDGAG